MQTTKRKLSGPAQMRKRGLRAVMIGLAPDEKRAHETFARDANQSMAAWIRTILQKIARNPELIKAITSNDLR